MKALPLLFVMFWATVSCIMLLNFLLLAEKQKYQEEEEKKIDKNKQKVEEENKLVTKQWINEEIIPECFSHFYSKHISLAH